ncbi:fumarylacetoacetate hydrolase family protein [Cellulomonas denverensis]|uniref:Fumarylacetoacetate hydrolase family protein n=1 Tax=Cellulomonas denverensis TaxID=264297 RepID=A0A7X6QXU5_9CELL|nr:fumarylacetoacetate hydrolase family protein [Cellulomonas denverensis]NKY21517.1 fumarylacetoacetate hydrolase family protein [Cellulomonas denverensis]GIG25408.1 2-hydroxyhepta-2,4-diene-1,7-dioate isomerase [Cellulomonas denverensis]
MRLVTWITPAGEHRPGAVVGDRVCDLGAVAADVVTILAGPGARARAEQAVAGASAMPALADVALAPPVTPGTLLCLGYNYAGHVAAGADPDDVPEYPNVFVKTPNTLAGPRDPVPLPAVSAHTDYEGEIALVIGRRAHRVPLDRAAEHIAGYTLLNDVSSRDWQDRSSQWTLGKCFDRFAPLGPWITTADEVPDPQDLLLEVIRDGVVTVSQSTASTVFPMTHLVHYLSQVLTLEPGDVISTGTPQKLPTAQAVHRPLAPGDAVTVRVAGLGELTTTFVSQEDHR